MSTDKRRAVVVPDRAIKFGIGSKTLGAVKRVDTWNSTGVKQEEEAGAGKPEGVGGEPQRCCVPDQQDAETKTNKQA